MYPAHTICQRQNVGQQIAIEMSEEEGIGVRGETLQFFRIITDNDLDVLSEAR